MARIERPETLTEAVANHIRDAIIRGDYAPGTALPEVRLAEELGTSRGTVREALRALEDLGLVEILPHRGTFVSRVTRTRAQELYDVRMVLESYAVRLAVERGALTGGVVDVVYARLADLEAAAKSADPMAVIEAERALHREIWSRCGHELLKLHLNAIQLQMRRLLIYNKAFSTPADEEVAMHRDLVAKILSGDPDRAEEAVREHIRSSAQTVLAKIPEDLVPGSGRS